MSRHSFHSRKTLSLLLYVATAALFLAVASPCIPLAGAAAAGGITVTRTLHLSSDMLRESEVLLLRLSSDARADDGALRATLRLGQSGWFPAWYIFLESETGLIPGGQLRVGPVSIASEAVYQVSLGYDYGTGTLAFVIARSGDNTVLERGIWKVETSNRVLRVLDADGVTAYAGYLPVAMSWDLVMQEEGGVLLPMRMIDRSSPMYVRAKVGAMHGGELRLIVSGRDRTVSVLLGEALYDETLYALPVEDYPVGPVTAAVEYWIAGEKAWTSEARSLTVGRVEGAVVSAETNPAGGTLDVTLRIGSDGALGETHVDLIATVKGLVWEETARRFIERVYSTHRYDLAVMRQGADGTLQVRIPIDNGPDLWRVEFELTTDPAVILQFVKTVATFGTWSKDVILSGSGARPIETSPLDLRRDWEEAIAAIESRYAGFDASQGAVVFVGSSSIRIWDTLEQDFPGLPVINAGFGGSRINEATQYVDRIIVPYNPHTVVVYSGSNDISGGFSPEWVFADYFELVKTIHAKLPHTRIIFISIAPSPGRWSQHARVEQANRLIKMYTETDERLEFVDVYPLMLGEDGLPIPHLYRADGVHMTRDGYVIWTQALRPYLGLQ